MLQTNQKPHSNQHSDTTKQIQRPKDHIPATDPTHQPETSQQKGDRKQRPEGQNGQKTGRVPEPKPSERVPEEAVEV